MANAASRLWSICGGRSSEPSRSVLILRQCLADLDPKEPGADYTRERLVAMAGFFEAVTELYDQMKRLPPNKFVSRVRNGQPVYLYSDPAACNCVYLGTQQNWDVYQQQLAARRMAKEEVSAAESQAEWDFGA